MPSKSFALRINKESSKKDVKEQLIKLENQINEYLEEPENFIKVNLEFVEENAKKIQSAFRFEQTEIVDDITIEWFISKLVMLGLEQYNKDNF